MDTELSVAANRRPERVLLVCDTYAGQPAGPGAESARNKVREWRAAGAEVLVLSSNPQTPGSLRSGYVEIEEVWVDGVTVYQVRFAPPIRRRGVNGHGAESSLRLALEGTLRQFKPDLLCLMLGPVFGAIPLRKAAEYGIAVEIVDSMSILGEPVDSHPPRRLRRVLG